MISEFTTRQRFSKEQHFGHYRIARQLGNGGFAKVYLGEHIFLNTYAAIKVLNNWLVCDEDESRFHTEAHMLANLRHQHIVRVLDFGLQGNTPFLAMEYAPHGTLRQHFPRGVRIPLRAVVPFVMQIASALQYIHNRQLIHCDVKPENILLGPRNEAWLSDFGIARSTRQAAGTKAQALQGTVAYAAPEQQLGDFVPASDQYALAVMVYEWLCGHLPFRGTPLNVCDQHLNTPPPSLRETLPALSPAVDRVILRALAKNPQKRFEHVQDFATALKQAYLLEERVQQQEYVRWVSLPPQSQRRMPRRVEMPPLEPVRRPVAAENVETLLYI